MVELKRIGHVLLQVSSLQTAIEFYRDLLRFELVEENSSGHQKMAFLSLGESGHNLDLIEVGEGELVDVGKSSLGHLAFEVDDFNALQKAYFHLTDAGIGILAAIDHLTQQSIYFQDPDGNTLEIYNEEPNALEVFRQGRKDREVPLEFTRPTD